jgi:iron-sulfur cluster assembly accessory protein
MILLTENAVRQLHLLNEQASPFTPPTEAPTGSAAAGAHENPPNDLPPFSGSSASCEHAPLPQTKHLRIRVESGGCAGMQYSMSLDFLAPADHLFQENGVGVLVDSESLRFLTGSTIDYCDDLAGAGFRIHNPNAVRSCGCGTSFEGPTAPPLAGPNTDSEAEGIPQRAAAESRM